MSSTSSFDLKQTALHLDNDHVVPLPDFGFDHEAFTAYINQHCTPGQPHRLMFIETSSENWGSWECHPEGDEIVVVLEGRGIFYQRPSMDCDAAEIERTPFQGGTTFLNRKGIWHTADVEEPMVALYLTPCPGTEHHPR